MNDSIDRRTFLRTQVLVGLGFSLSGELRAARPEDRSLPFLLTPESRRYDELRVRFNRRVERRPAFIALCEDTEQVAQAIRFAGARKLRVSVKSGGHSFEGFSSNDGGLVVDLSLLDRVQEVGNQQIRVGPGCTLEKLYDALLPKGRLLPAGSCGGVGVGGLTLGGGYGLFSRLYGLTCDHLLGVRFVDGRGNIHDTSEAGEIDDELLWACRGGARSERAVDMPTAQRDESSIA